MYALISFLGSTFVFRKWLVWSYLHDKTGDLKLEVGRLVNKSLTFGLRWNTNPIIDNFVGYSIAG
jgi:hypothetical protein